MKEKEGWKECDRNRNGEIGEKRKGGGGGKDRGKKDEQKIEMKKVI